MWVSLVWYPGSYSSAAQVEIQTHGKTYRWSHERWRGNVPKGLLDMRPVSQAVPIRATPSGVVLPPATATPGPVRETVGLDLFIEVVRQLVKECLD